MENVNQLVFFIIHTELGFFKSEGESPYFTEDINKAVKYKTKKGAKDLIERMANCWGTSITRPGWYNDSYKRNPKVSKAVIGKVSIFAKDIEWEAEKGYFDSVAEARLKREKEEAKKEYDKVLSQIRNLDEKLEKLSEKL
jgi:hypothetical protein